MSAVRIRGTWSLTLSQYEGQSRLNFVAMGAAVLEIQKANRAGIEGQFVLDGKKVSVKGRVKPGSPAVVTFSEVNEKDEAVESGLEAMLFIPPWWPNVDYKYDFIAGTLVIGPQSKIADKKTSGTLISVSGVQPFE